MKFKTFRLLVVAGAVVLIGGIGYNLFKPRATIPASAAGGAVEQAAMVQGDPAIDEPAAGDPAGPGLRDVDFAVLRAARKPLKGDKVKDAFRSQTYKVNLYSDGGSGRVDRVKIDLDRDNAWDEKWTFDGETVKREVAPNDDEKYSESYRLEAGAFCNPTGGLILLEEPG